MRCANSLPRSFGITQYSTIARAIAVCSSGALSMMPTNFARACPLMGGLGAAKCCRAMLQPSPWPRWSRATPRSFTVDRRDERSAACLLGQGRRNGDSYASEPLPRLADDARKHASAGCALAVGRLQALSPRGCAECGPRCDAVPVPAFGPRMACSACRIIGAHARPNSRERPTTESLTGAVGGIKGAPSLLPCGGT